MKAIIDIKSSKKTNLITKRLIDAKTGFHTSDFDSISSQADTVNKDTVCKMFYFILV